MPDKKGVGWRVIVMLVGLLVVIVGYYWVHKPLNIALLASLGGAVLDVLVVGMVVTVSGGLGRLVLSWIIAVGARHDRRESLWDALPLLPISRSERVALDGLLGLGLLACLALLLGLGGLYTGTLFWIMLMAVGVLTVRSLIGWLRDLLAVLRAASHSQTTWTRFLLLLAAFWLVTALLHALTPPAAFDALNYHLVAPARYLSAGRVSAYPDNFFLGFPQGVEILYGVVMGLFRRDTAAAPLHFAFGLLALLATGGITRRYLGESAGWLAVVLLMSAFSIWALFGWPYVDLAIMAYGAAALVTASVWSDSRDRRWLIVLGLVGGMALGVKYTAAGLLLAIAVYVLLHEPRRILRHSLIIGAAAALVFLPWAVKGLLLYQNPVYPFLFDGLNWDSMRANTFSTPGTGLIGMGRAWQLPILPLAATIFGVERGEAFSFTAGPWLLTAPLLLPLVWGRLNDRARQLAKHCLLLAVPILLFWMVMAVISSIGVQTRLVVIGLPLAAILGAVALDGLSRWPRKPLNMAFVARAMLVLTLLFGAADTLRETVQARVVPYLLGMVNRDDFLVARLGAYSQAMRRLNDLPDGARIRLMWEPRTYYCPVGRVCAGDMLFDHWARALRQTGTPEAVFAAWRGTDDALLIFDTGYQFWKDDPRFIAENQQFMDAVEEYMTPVWSENGYTLYAWKPENP